MSNATSNSKSLHTGITDPEDKYLGAGSAQQDNIGGIPSENDLKNTIDPHPGSISDGRNPEADEGDEKPPADRPGRKVAS